jgi:polar amino acid transport system substrate-binding protein
MFIQNQSGTARAFEKALADNDRRLAERLAHTCRGVAGNIGATNLQHLAMTLELAVNRNQPVDVVNNVFELFAEELDRVLDSLRNSLSSLPAISQDVTQFDEERAGKAMILLQRYLQDNDGRAEHYLHECRDDLNGLPHESVKRLRLSITNFDYAAAIDVLAELSAKTGININAENQEEMDD